MSGTILLISGISLFITTLGAVSHAIMAYAILKTRQPYRKLFAGYLWVMIALFCIMSWSSIAFLSGLHSRHAHNMLFQALSIPLLLHPSILFIVASRIEESEKRLTITQRYQLDKPDKRQSK